MFAILRDWKTKPNRLKAALSRGRPSGMPRGTWVSDLAACKKAIALCGDCRKKFHAKSARYERRPPVPGYPEARGECDGCGAGNSMCAIYFPVEEKH